MRGALRVLVLTSMFTSLACRDKTSERERELEVELAKAKASQVQAEAEKAKIEAAAQGSASPCAGLADHAASVLIDEPLSRGEHIVDPTMRGAIRRVF